MKKFLPALSLLLVIGLFSCSKSTIVGSDLLAQDQVDIDFTDSFNLVAVNLTTDSVRTFTPEFSNQLVAYLVGEMEDPIFGRTLAKIQTDFRPGSEEPDFTDAELDSIVLVLPYYAFSQYGDTTEIYGLEVFELQERLDASLQYYSNADVAVAGSISSSVEFRPSPNDSITIQVHGGEPDETTALPAQLRIRLDDSYGQRFLDEDVETFEDDSTFLDAFPGIQIAPTTTNQGLSAFNLRTDDDAAIVVYYHVGEDFESYEFSFNSSVARFVTFEHDYSGSLAESYLDDEEKADSLLFLQGMSGISFTLEIPNPEFFADKVVNRAELELTALTIPEDLGSPFDPAEQLIVSEVTDTGLIIIQDVIFGLERDELAAVFGGFYNDSESPAVFTMSLSAHLREMSLGLASNKIRVTVLARPEIPNRIILGGPGHADHPVKLRVNFTNL